MSQNNHLVVRANFQHEITIEQIPNPKVAYDIIKWCMENTEDWTKEITKNNQLLLTFQDPKYQTLFMIQWSDKVQCTAYINPQYRFLL